MSIPQWPLSPREPHFVNREPTQEVRSTNIMCCGVKEHQPGEHARHPLDGKARAADSRDSLFDWATLYPHCSLDGSPNPLFLRAGAKTDPLC